MIKRSTLIVFVVVSVLCAVHGVSAKRKTSSVEQLTQEEIDARIAVLEERKRMFREKRRERMQARKEGWADPGPDTSNGGHHRHRSYSNPHVGAPNKAFCDTHEQLQGPYCEQVEGISNLDTYLQATLPYLLEKHSHIDDTGRDMAKELAQVLTSIKTTIEKRGINKLIVLGLRERCFHTHRNVHEAVYNAFKFIAPVGSTVCFLPDKVMSDRGVAAEWQQTLEGYEDALIFTSLWRLYNEEEHGNPGAIEIMSKLMEQTQRSIFMVHRVEKEATFGPLCEKDEHACKQLFSKVWREGRFIHWREFRCHPGPGFSAVPMEDINGDDMPFTYALYEDNTLISNWPTSLLPADLAGLERSFDYVYEPTGQLNTERAFLNGIVFVGSIWGLNHLEILDLAHAANAKLNLNVQIHGQCKVGPLCGMTLHGVPLDEDALKLAHRFVNVTAKGALPTDEAVTLQTNALLVPAIQGQGHFEGAPDCCYIPDRTYKALSMGHMVVSNNPCVKEAFQDIPEHVLVHDALNDTFSMKELLQEAINVRLRDTRARATYRALYTLAKHSYLQRIETLLRLQQDVKGLRSSKTREFNFSRSPVESDIATYCPREAELDAEACRRASGYSSSDSDAS